MKKSVSFLTLTALLTVTTILTLMAGLFLPVGAADEQPIDVSANVSEELPALFSYEEGRFELEDIYNEDGNGCLHNQAGDFNYYYLKGDPATAYMRLPFTVDKEGTYQVCIGLMGITSSVPRSAELSFNGEGRYYMELDYRDIPDGSLSHLYVSGITAYLRKGVNELTFYLGSSFDNINMKSLFLDNFFVYRTDDLPAGYVFPDTEEEEQVDITGAVPEKLVFNHNFRSLVTSTVFCTPGYVQDAEKGEVLELTVSEDLEPIRFAFSYRKYQKLLGLEPSEDTCDQYPFVVLAIKADDALIDGTIQFCYFTAGNDFVDFERSITMDFDNNGEWQYVLFEMEYGYDWYDEFNGGSFFLGSSGSDVGGKVRIAELSLFKTYNEAARYCGMEVTGETGTDAAPTEAATDPVTEAPDTDTAVTGTPASDASETIAVSDTQPAGTEKPADKGCSSALGGCILLCMLPAILIPLRKKKG